MLQRYYLESETRPLYLLIVVPIFISPLMLLKSSLPTMFLSLKSYMLSKGLESLDAIIFLAVAGPTPCSMSSISALVALFISTWYFGTRCVMIVALFSCVQPFSMDAMRSMNKVFNITNNCAPVYFVAV